MESTSNSLNPAIVIQLMMDKKWAPRIFDTETLKFAGKLGKSGNWEEQTFQQIIELEKITLDSKKVTATQVRKAYELAYIVSPEFYSFFSGRLLRQYEEWNTYYESEKFNFTKVSEFFQKVMTTNAKLFIEHIRSHGEFNTYYLKSDGGNRADFDSEVLWKRGWASFKFFSNNPVIMKLITNPDIIKNIRSVKKDLEILHKINERLLNASEKQAIELHDLRQRLSVSIVDNLTRFFALRKSENFGKRDFAILRDFCLHYRPVLTNMPLRLLPTLVLNACDKSGVEIEGKERKRLSRASAQALSAMKSRFPRSILNKLRAGAAIMLPKSPKHPFR